MVDTPVHGLHTAVATAGDGSPIFAFLGAVNSGTVRLANAALKLDINPPTIDPLLKHAALSSSPSSPPLILAGAESGGPVVLTLEGMDALDRAHAGVVENAVGVCVGVSGVIVGVVRMNEVVSGRGLEGILGGLERSLGWRVDGIVGGVPLRRLIVIVVTAFEEGVVEEADVETFVRDKLEAGYDDFNLGGDSLERGFGDLFDVKVVCLVGETLDGEKWESGVAELGALLKEEARDFVDAGMTGDGLIETVERVWALVDGEGKVTVGLPEEVELKGSFGCGVVMTTVLDGFRSTSKQWKGTVDSGRIIRNFGKECDRLIEETLGVYEKDAVVYKGTRVFGRKREELKTAMLADAYLLFAKQIQKLREVAYQVFRGKLARIRINEKVEKNVKEAVKEAETYFVENAESLRCKSGDWRFDNERQELVTHMREDATERLQLARLQGNYVPSMRSPIAFAFHTLLLAPFGRDSRFGAVRPEDMQQRFDPDKVKQAGLMRLRPTQRNGFKYNVKAQDGPECVEMFADLFEDAPAK